MCCVNMEHNMFVNLLSIIAGAAACLGAVLTGKGSGKFNLGWVVGLAVGFCCFLVLTIGLKSVLKKLKLYESKLSPAKLMLSWLLCLIAFLWIIVSAFLGSWLTRLVIQ